MGLDEARREVNKALDGMHPEDRAKAFREMEQWCKRGAEAQEETNERIGIPERPNPLDEEIARSEL